MKWITGSSSGFGLALCQTVADTQAEKVIATSRSAPQSSSELEVLLQQPNCTWEQLDISGPDFDQQVKRILQKHANIDVLINNAGYGVGGALEEVPLSNVRDMYETNVFGPIRLIQAVLPGMRKEKKGTIINISSATVTQSPAGLSAYTSSKCAIEGISEVLAAEVASFGIRVLIAQPGGMRTKFLDSSKVSSTLVPLSEGYKNTMVDWVLQAVAAQDGAQPVDPIRAAEALVGEVLRPTLRKVNGEASQPIVRLQLGRESQESNLAKLSVMTGEAEVTKQVAIGCDFSAA